MNVKRAFASPLRPGAGIDRARVRAEPRTRGHADRLVVDADEAMASVIKRLGGLHHLHLAENSNKVCAGQPLDVGGPGDEGVAVPEADRFPVPLGHLLHMLAADQNLAQEVVGDCRKKLDPHVGVMLSSKLGA